MVLAAATLYPELSPLLTSEAKSAQSAESSEGEIVAAPPRIRPSSCTKGFTAPATSLYTPNSLSYSFALPGSGATLLLTLTIFDTASSTVE